ncbi:DUF4440 domain-containing protein [Pseudomonas sp. NPDC008258]|uniref:DUF4440 domain-containing protein n=1 Tax=Pseudomonas sp. NPDC008258 TaxID=3364418 RepID=UPI0036E50023
MKKLPLLLLLTSIGLVGTCMQALATDTRHSIDAKLQGIAGLWSKKDAKAVVDEVYTEQTEITGEGVNQLYKGKAQLTELLSRLMEGSRSTVLHLDRLQQIGDDAAYTWVTWDVTPVGDELPFKMKSLFVWKKEHGAWYIVADMFAAGAIAN